MQLLIFCAVVVGVIVAGGILMDWGHDANARYTARSRVNRRPTSPSTVENQQALRAKIRRGEL